MTESPNASLPRPIEFNSTAVIDIRDDLPCARCAYNLRGLTAEARCPECGSAVALSLHGNWLHLADPVWLRKLWMGATLKIWAAFIGFLIGGGVGFAAAFNAPVAVGSTLGALGGLLGLAAIFLITAPEPTIGTSEDPVTLRKTIRICAVIGFFGGQISHNLGSAVPWRSLVIVGQCLAIANVVAMFGEYVYLRRFARRIPNVKLARQTTVVMWGMGVTMSAGAVFGLIALLVFGGLFIGGGRVAIGGAAAAGNAPAGLTAGMGVLAGTVCVIGLGVLVFGVLNLILMFRYYGAFKRAALESRRVAGAAA